MTQSLRGQWQTPATASASQTSRCAKDDSTHRVGPGWNTSIPDRENDSDAKYQVRDRSGKCHARRLGNSVHPPHAEDITQYRDERDQQSGSSEHLRAQIPFSAVVWSEKERERIEEKTSRAVYRYAAWRSPASLGYPVAEKQKIESRFAAADVLVESEDCDCSNESGECLLDSFSRRGLPWAHRDDERAAGEHEAQRGERDHWDPTGLPLGDDGKVESPSGKDE